MRHLSVFLVLLILFQFSGCSVLTTVRVIEKDHSQLNLSLGGPFVPSSVSTAVIPYTTLGYAYGLRKDLTISGNLHILSALFKTPGIDAGAVYQLTKEEQYIPELSLYPKLYFFKGLRQGSGMRVLPSLALNASYTLWGSHLLYAGVDYMFQLTDDSFYATPFIGYQFPVSQKFQLQAEFKWMAANAETKYGVFEGESSISGKGTIGLFVGVNYAL